MNEPAAIVLAAGKSTRMQSAIPKVLHEICGRPMIEQVLETIRSTGVRRIVVVVGFEAEQVKQALAADMSLEFALQQQQNGTGHAVLICKDLLADHDGPVLVLAGDTPLLRADSLAGLLQDQAAQNASCVIGTATTADNEGLGRIVRDADGAVLRIVEQKDASPEEAAIQEVNTGCFAFDCHDLFAALDKVRPNNQQAEYYLTDVPEILNSDGKLVIATPRFDIVEAMGVNTQAQLAEVERVLESRGCRS